MSNSDKLSKRESIRSLLTNPHQQPLDAQKIIERIPETDPVGIQGIVSSQIELLTLYHNVVLDQAKRSFRWAIISAVIGFLIFLVAIGFVFLGEIGVASISVISCVLIEMIATINFNLYAKSSQQLIDFQNRLDDIQRLLLANSMSETMEGELKHQARLEIIKALLVFSNKKEK